MDVHPVRGTV